MYICICFSWFGRITLLLCIFKLHSYTPQSGNDLYIENYVTHVFIFFRSLICPLKIGNDFTHRNHKLFWCYTFDSLPTCIWSCNFYCMAYIIIWKENIVSYTLLTALKYTMYIVDNKIYVINYSICLLR